MASHRHRLNSTAPQQADPLAAAADRLKPAASLHVYSVAEAKKLYPLWTVADHKDSLPQLARLIRSQLSGVLPLTLIYGRDRSLYGLGPVAGQLYGFILPPLGADDAGECTSAAQQDDLSTSSSWTDNADPNPEEDPTQYRAAVFALAGRIAAARSAGDLERELAAFRPTTAGPPPTVVPLRLPELPPTLIPTPTKPQSTIHRLLATYRDDSCEFIQSAGRVHPPQPTEVERLLDSLFPLLFPGYRGPLPADPLFNSFVLRRVSALQPRLARLVRRALAFRASWQEPSVPPSASHHNAANQIAVHFLDALPDIRRTLNADAEAAYRNDPALLKGDHHPVPLAYPGLQATATYRVAHQLHVLEVPYIPRMLTELAHSRTGIDIHPGARIGKGFFIDHGTGVVIGETAVIGEKVTLYQGVTLGAINFKQDGAGDLIRGPERKRHPTICSKTTIYANAAVLGDIEVGQKSKIGANVSLRQSVAPESVVRLPKEFRQVWVSDASSPVPDETGRPSEDDDIAQVLSVDLELGGAHPFHEPVTP